MDDFEPKCDVEVDSSGLNGKNKRLKKKAPRADMTESKPWRPNILPLLCRIEPIFSSKVPGQLNCHLSKYYRKLSFKDTQRARELSPDTLYTDCDLMGMDVTGARLWQSLSNAVSRIIAWLATAGETVPQQTEHTAKLANIPWQCSSPC